MIVVISTLMILGLDIGHFDLANVNVEPLFAPILMVLTTGATTTLTLLEYIKLQLALKT